MSVASINITSKYAALLSLLFIFLTYRIISFRRGNKVSLGVVKAGDAKGSENLERRVRSHANFAEYVPLSLLLIAFIEFNNGNTLIVHSLGAALLIGRSMHAHGLTNAVFFTRVFGTVLQISVLLLSAVYILLWILLSVTLFDKLIKHFLNIITNLTKIKQAKITTFLFKWLFRNINRLNNQFNIFV